MRNDSSVFASFTCCPYKAFLQFKEEAGRDDALEFCFNRQSAEYRNSIIEKRQIGLNGPNPLRDRWIGFEGGSNDGELIMCEAGTDCEILAQDIASGEERGTGYVPLLCHPAEKISNQQKLLLAYAAYSLAKAGYAVAPFGKIIHGSDHRTLRVQLAKLSREVNKTATALDQIRAGKYEPPLILNSHCKVCRFSSHCRTKAIDKDDLSLISSLSEKEILKLNKKGIFSVTQLSHTYRARRGRRKTETIEKHSVALKALAIREKKIYVIPADKPQIGRIQIFFDVEGIPDKDLYYLIGAKVIDGTNETTHSFWADSGRDEEKIWRRFLSMIAAFDSFSLVHFGGYESAFVARMLKRYGTIIEVPAERLKSASVNILTFCHLNVYFPTYSNSLKELAIYLKFQWSYPGSSGLDSINWRERWETSKEDVIKQKLLRYNLDDCEALKLLTNAVLEILEHGTKGQEPVVAADSIAIDSSYKFGSKTFALPDLELISKCAYFNYQHSKVYWRTDGNIKKSLRRAAKQRRRSQRVNKVITFKMPRCCPVCRSTQITRLHNEVRTIYDLRFSTSGVRKWITRMVTVRLGCQKCQRSYVPNEYVVAVSNIMGREFEAPNTGQGLSGSLRSNKWKRLQKYGRGLLAWVIYQNIGMRQTGRNIIRGLNDIFGFGLATINANLVNKFKGRAEEFYEEAYFDIVKSIQSGHLVHVDETKINLKGTRGYVWVFTNFEEVLYIYSNSREGEILSTVLKDFKGVLVSDFYGAYDSFPCLQQKCLVHLIRDLNDDLLKNQFDHKFKELVEAFGGLLRPIIATTDAHGLKTYFLRKHKVDVDEFFEWCLAEEYSSELARKYQTRFKKNRGRLFTFLDHDGVP